MVCTDSGGFRLVGYEFESSHGHCHFLLKFIYFGFYQARKVYKNDYLKVRIFVTTNMTCEKSRAFIKNITSAGNVVTCLHI